jgi:uncharacterized membrane protein
MGAYLMMFAAWGIGLPLPVLNLVAAVIYHFVNRKNSRFVAFHSLQSLLSQVPVTAANIGLIVLIVRNLIVDIPFGAAFFGYVAIVVVLNVLYVTLSIIGMVRAKKGRFFYFPAFGSISFERYYGDNAVDFTKPVPPNKPPGRYGPQ